MNWYSVQVKKHEKRATVIIYDEIGFFGMSAQTLFKEIKALGDLDEIDLRINSAGGSIFDGFAIYNFLRSHPATINVFIDGLAASISSVIALAGDTVNMAANGFIMIHDPWLAGFGGDSHQLRKDADYLDKLKESLISIYEAKTSLSRDRLNQMMKDETWLNADEALDLGFIDNISDEIKAAAKLNLDKFENVPKAALPFAQPNNKRNKKMDPKNPKAGANLGSLIDDQVESMVTEDRTRADIITELAEAADISEGTVNGIISGTPDCPPLIRLEGFATVLDATVDQLRTAAESDGCDYSSEDEPEDGDDGAGGGDDGAGGGDGGAGDAEDKIELSKAEYTKALNDQYQKGIGARKGETQNKLDEANTQIETLNSQLADVTSEKLEVDRKLTAAEGKIAGLTRGLEFKDSGDSGDSDSFEPESWKDFIDHATKNTEEGGLGLSQDEAYLKGRKEYADLHKATFNKSK